MKIENYAEFSCFRNVIPPPHCSSNSSWDYPLPSKFPIFGDAVILEFHPSSTEVVQVLCVMFFHSEGAVLVQPDALFSTLHLLDPCLALDPSGNTHTLSVSSSFYYLYYATEERSPSSSVCVKLLQRLH